MRTPFTKKLYWGNPINFTLLKPFIVVMSLLCGIQEQMMAQIEFEFLRTFGSTTNDSGNDAVTDNLGNTYIVGQFTGTVDFSTTAVPENLTSTGNPADMFILKLDPMGEFVWARSYGSSGVDVITSVAVDDNQNVYFAGYGRGINFGGGLLGSTLTEGYVVKLDADGNHQWSIALGGGGNERPRSIAVDDDGEFVYVSGEFTGDLSPFGFTAVNQNDGFICKINGSTGATVWGRHFAGTGQQTAQGIAVDLSGNIYTTGFFEDTVDFDPAGMVPLELASNGGNDIFVGKYNSDGLSEWVYAFGSTGGESGNDITVDNEGGVYFTGSFSGTIDFDPGMGVTNLTSDNGRNAIICKLNDLGELEWATQTKGTGEGIIIHPITEDVGVSGSLAGIYDCSMEDTDGDNAFIATYTSEGSLIAKATMGGSGFDYGRAITSGMNETFIVTGVFREMDANFDPAGIESDVASAGVNDIFVVWYSYSAENLCGLTFDNIAVENESILGANDGSINISVTCASCGELLYSIDNGDTFVSDPLFENLMPGTYNVVVINEDNPCCIIFETVEVLEGLPCEPTPWTGNDINTTGSSTFVECEDDGVIELSGAGFSSSTMDRMHIVSQSLCGDGMITGRIASKEGLGWMGLIMRETLDPGSKKAAIKSQLSNFIFREARAQTNGATQKQHIFRPQHTWLRLVRNGNSFQGYSSTNGVNWQFAFSANIAMANCIHVGVFVEGINNSDTTSGTFDQVEVEGGDPLMIGRLDDQIYESNHQDPGLTVYPNPGNGQFFIDLKSFQTENAFLSIYDGLGTLVKSEKYQGGNLESVNLTGAPGVYHFRFELSNGEVINKRVVKQ